MKSLLQPSFLARSCDLGLLVLRVSIGLGLLLKHGLEKIFHFSQMAAHFPDPVHIGSHASLVFAMVSDAICSILVIVGAATRLAAFVIFVNVAVAYALVHNFGFHTDHGELVYIYMGCFLSLMLTGPGRYSVDAIWLRNQEK